MESFQVKASDTYPGKVAYGSRSNKKMVQTHYETMVVFERDIVKTGLTAVTFPTINGANKMLDSLKQDNRIEPINALIIEKNKHGQLSIRQSISQPEYVPKCSELSLVVALLLRGSVAADLLGGAAPTLLAHQIELGIARAEIDSMVEDMVADNAILFVLDYQNLAPVIFNPNNDSQYDFSLTDQVVQKVKIMATTLEYYWFED